MQSATSRGRRVVWGFVALLAAGIGPATRDAATAENLQGNLGGGLVTATPGTLPILLSAPHGGTRRMDGVPNRTGENVARKRGAKTNFSFAFDRNTDTLTFAVASAIERLTGQRPYVVVAHFSRRQIDANRPAEEAVESEEARKVYDAYHDALRQFRAEILARHGTGILIDLHGHGGNPEVLYRGTADGQTVRNLRETRGQDALTGDTGLLAPLARAGIKLQPENGSPAAENPALNGGYIVRKYGSFAGGSFDAVQLELGGALRGAERLPGVAEALGESLVQYWRKYLVRQDDGHGGK